MIDRSRRGGACCRKVWKFFKKKNREAVLKNRILTKKKIFENKDVVLTGNKKGRGRPFGRRIERNYFPL
ncbi:hypothetical protein CH380_12295 [Leptospira adleri]|uniref:Uncharacterized protein n=1 Tax=Leptospira adleri TaxID=2023186 RepID=A0A2M9YMZ8_9LEPT|nr:hypothetical protein CH380_12295 [Leptospira adleri]PJZ60747.1 hypothetical protein CH376_16875 [Leptospira adleri]